MLQEQRRDHRSGARLPRRAVLGWAPKDWEERRLIQVPPLRAAHLVWQVWVQSGCPGVCCGGGQPWGSPTSCSLGSWQGASGVDPAPFIHGCRAEPGPLPQARGQDPALGGYPQQPSVSKSWLSSHPPWCTWAVMGTNPSSGGDRPRTTSRSPQLLEALGNLRDPRDQITLSWVGVKCSSSWFIPSRMWGLWGTSSILLQPPVPGFRAR